MQQHACFDPNHNHFLNLVKAVLFQFTTSKRWLFPNVRQSLEIRISSKLNWARSFAVRECHFLGDRVEFELNLSACKLYFSLSLSFSLFLSLSKWRLWWIVPYLLWPKAQAPHFNLKNLSFTNLSCWRMLLIHPKPKKLFHCCRAKRNSAAIKEEEIRFAGMCASFKFKFKKRPWGVITFFTMIRVVLQKNTKLSPLPSCVDHNKQGWLWRWCAQCWSICHSFVIVICPKSPRNQGNRGW